MRTAFEVHACTASLAHIGKNSIHKLICVKIFIRKSFVFQYTTIHEICWISNYGNNTGAHACIHTYTLNNEH